MVGLSALWIPILVSAVFVFVVLLISHMMPGWHKSDMTMVPGEDEVMETLRRLNVKPGDYRFPFSNSVDEMKSPAFEAKMNRGAVGIMTIWPNGEVNMGKAMGLWFVYSLVIAVIVAYVTGQTHAPGATRYDVFQVSGIVAFCCYAMAHWQNWIWWGKGTRFTVTNTVDGLAYALVTAGAFAWLWPK